MTESNSQPGAGNSSTPGDQGFSREYVAELRQENATWRTKLREMETQLNQFKQADAEYALNEKIISELSERGIPDVDPTWVEVAEGQEVKDAVGVFLEKHPRFKVEAPEEGLPKMQQINQNSQSTQQKRPGGKPMPTETKNTNVNRHANDYATIKKDPIARTKLRELYRGMLAQQQNSGMTI